MLQDTYRRCTTSLGGPEESASPMKSNPVSLVPEPISGGFNPMVLSLTSSLWPRFTILIHHHGSCIIIIVNSNLNLQGIGNGIPLGAVMTTPEIAGVLSRRSYFNTFGGNPMCTAAGHAVLRVIHEEKLQQNAFLVGSHLKRRLASLRNKHEREFFLVQIKQKFFNIFCLLKSYLFFNVFSNRRRERERIDARS